MMGLRELLRKKEKGMRMPASPAEALLGLEAHQRDVELKRRNIIDTILSEGQFHLIFKEELETVLGLHEEDIIQEKGTCKDSEKQFDEERKYLSSLLRKLGTALYTVKRNIYKLHDAVSELYEEKGKTYSPASDVLVKAMEIMHHEDEVNQQKARVKVNNESLKKVLDAKKKNVSKQRAQITIMVRTIRKKDLDEQISKVTKEDQKLRELQESYYTLTQKEEELNRQRKEIIAFLERLEEIFTYTVGEEKQKAAKALEKVQAMVAQKKVA
jgi:hypothetical protein